jgi:hypothetical protein
LPKIGDAEAALQVKLNKGLMNVAYEGGCQIGAPIRYELIIVVIEVWPGWV